MSEKASEDFNEMVRQFIEPKISVKGLVALLEQVRDQKKGERKTVIRKELGYIYDVQEKNQNYIADYLDQNGIRRTIFYNSETPQYSLSGVLMIGEVIEVEVENVIIKSVRVLKLNGREKQAVVAKFKTLE